MVNCDVAVLPKERRPTARECPHPAEPAIEELRCEDWPVGMVVEVDADIDSGNPAQHQSRSQHKGYTGPWASDAGYLGVEVEPERANIGRETNEMKEYAVPVLRVGENAPGPQHCRGRSGAGLWDHSNLKAAAIAMTVTPRLTQGPHSAAPRMIAIANSGKNDLARTNVIRDTNTRARLRILSSFPLRLGWGGTWSSEGCSVPGSAGTDALYACVAELNAA